MISLSIPLDLIEEVDKIVEKSGKPRSRVICELIERALDLGAYYD
ncbi:MAG: ribbon-helix-helix protein, CopG family [Thermotogae bacterium]|nr:ribbon-helix-helix protein, CopG family [Thermotogota bacterium]